ncbi:MAG TPA: phosphopantetheine-binding protein [Casimicrobiaceae bacterium]|nr:phosphopantetheine-binding protein [Casimicrobiaceae bacterium]
MNETYEKVKALIVSEFDVVPERITPSTPLTDLGVDSLAALEFVFTLEDAFHVSVDSDADLRSGMVQDVVDIVEAALSAQLVPAGAD